MSNGNQKISDLTARFEAAYIPLVTILDERHKAESPQYRSISMHILSGDDGWSTLSLSSDGSWVGKTETAAMMAYDVSGDLDNLVKEYAEINDPVYRNMRFSDDDDDDSEKLVVYREEHYAQLLQGFVEELEEVLNVQQSLVS